MLTSGAYTRWPDTQVALLGSVGWLPFGVAVATVVFLGLNSQISRKTLANTQASLDQARRAEVGNRFQKALELLESDSVATRVGGIAVLRDVAADAPNEYWPTVVQVLVHLIEASTNDRYDEVMETMDNYNRYGGDHNDDPPEYAATQQDIVRALEVLGLKAPKLRAAVMNSATNEQIVIRRSALIGIELRHLVLTYIEFDGVYAQGLEFDACSCARMSGRLYGQYVEFTDCDLGGADLNFVTTPWSYDRVAFERCNLSRVRIHSRGATPFRIDRCNVDTARLAVEKLKMLASWWMDAPPDRPEDLPKRKDNVWDAVDVTGKAPMERTQTGFPVYRAMVLEDELTL